MYQTLSNRAPESQTGSSVSLLAMVIAPRALSSAKFDFVGTRQLQGWSYFRNEFAPQQLPFASCNAFRSGRW